MPTKYVAIANHFPMRLDMATKLYMNAMGYTEKRPANFPAVDRGAVMREAHIIAKRFRQHYGSYREALAYGLAAAWGRNWSNRMIQSVASQVPRPVATAAPRSYRRRPLYGSYAYLGA